MFSTGEQFCLELKSIGYHRIVNRIWDVSNNYRGKGKGPAFILCCIAFSQAALNPHNFSVTIICWANKHKLREWGENMLSYYFIIYLPLPCFQSDFSSVAMTRSGLSLEELRIVEGQGQSSEVITPPEEISRMNDLGV